jgi:enamine deaminase RidA (YjgF/YER057c/UK114 family)
VPHVERMHIPELFPPPGYAHVAVATDPRLVLTAGAVPLDRDGSIVGVGDVRVQTRQTLDNLMVQLAAGGAGGEDVLKTKVYVASTDRADLVAVWEEVQRSPIAAAASTLLGVALLGYPEQLVEIEAVAVLP